MIKKLVVFILLLYLLWNTMPVSGVVLNVEDLDTQIDGLMNRVAEICDMDKELINELYIMTGKALYTGKEPNIYTDETVHSAKAPMTFNGVDTSYREIPLENLNNVSRIMKYYLPDAMYSVSSDISGLMEERRAIDRGDMQPYFDTLVEDIQNRVLFYEAVLEYTGVDTALVNRFLTAYESVLSDKESDEYVVEINDQGLPEIKEKFRQIFYDIGFTDYNSLEYLARMFSNDRTLAENDDIENFRSVYLIPYEPNKTSRENMMLAAASLVGKVRYVWGGGHSGASYIDGINPVWAKFNAMYPSDDTEEGYNTCIKPSGSWCPIHGYSSAEYHGGVVYSLDSYVGSRADSLDSSELLNDKYREMLSQVDYSHGINAHTLDGLDCSGFASWLYNQVTEKYQINSTARDFTKQSGVVPLEFGCNLLPGDMFAWTRHIVIIAGRVSEDSKSYVTVESTPSVLRYGVVYYDGASQQDIDHGLQIAREANELIGGITLEPHLYCMNSVGYYKVSKHTETVDVLFPYIEIEGYDPYALIPSGYVSTTETETEDGILVTYTIEHELEEGEDPEVRQYIEVGRLDVDFEDEEGYETRTAEEILQGVVNRLPLAYVSGYSDYSGDIFDKYSLLEE